MVQPHSDENICLCRLFLNKQTPLFDESRNKVIGDVQFLEEKITFSNHGFSLDFEGMGYHYQKDVSLWLTVNCNNYAK